MLQKQFATQQFPNKYTTSKENLSNISYSSRDSAGTSNSGFRPAPSGPAYPRKGKDDDLDAPFGELSPEWASLMTLSFLLLPSGG